MPERAALPARTLVVVMLVALLAGGGWYAWRQRGAASGPVVAAPGAAAPASAASAPPVSVTLVRAVRRDVPVLLEATGTVSALTSVDVKPQVASVVTQVHVKEGQFVRKGDLLFTLDSRGDQANLGKAQAQLQKDLAALADAPRQLARSQELFAQNFISQGAVDTNRALVEAQQAGVAADRAAIDAARVAVSYARIVAPSGGRVGQIPVVTGSYVQPGGTPMVTITQLDPISVAFSLPQRHLPDALAALRGNGAPVRAQLPEGRGTLNGRLQFVDNAVDAATGTVRVKAQFDNREQQLWPGAFVGVRLAVRTLKDAVVVPQAAIVQSPRGTVVFAVGEGNRVAARPVEVLYASGNDAAVKGLDGTERLVLDGRQNVRPGSVVVERAAPAAGAASRAASAP
ncbi:MAG: efflux RND transporter periplasmic adaptor subunit [Burkholderiaceae bacterium]|nr:MAG: efflux RND transporter periplasmic adaptor subunit [Burkholderiaceae bacterium]